MNNVASAAASITKRVLVAACRRRTPCLAASTVRLSHTSGVAFVARSSRQPRSYTVEAAAPMYPRNRLGMASQKISTAVEEAAPTGEDILASFGSPEQFEGTDVPRAMEMLARADAVCFDVDSTVIQEEGIDVLADCLGRGEEVAAWTAKAMEGDTKFEEALAARLSIIQPSRSDIARCLEETPLQLSPGVDRLISALTARGTDVYLVSGGFRIMIQPLAKQLGLAESNIVANTILFDEEGNYAGFDASEPTSADQGKPKALRQIKETHGYDVMVMVGDGATDAQAMPPADSFVGFGGVAVRDVVREKACWFVRDFEAMIDVVTKHGKGKSTK